MKISYNGSSLNAYNALARSDNSMVKTSARISSGVKIKSASDNAANLAIANSLRMQTQGIDKAGQNASNGISVLQTADGGLNEIQNIVQRVRELSIQAANDTNTTEDRETIQIEVDQLSKEIDEMVGKSDFNKIKLLDGGYEENSDLQLVFHVGSNKGLSLKVNLPKISSELLKLNTDESSANPLNVVTNPQTALVAADEALTRLSEYRARIGAYQNRLEHTVNNLAQASTSTSESLSRIFDTDMAGEMAEYSRLSVLTQTATSIMAQANQTPQNIIQLLQ